MNSDTPLRVVYHEAPTPDRTGRTASPEPMTLTASAADLPYAWRRIRRRLSLRAYGALVEACVFTEDPLPLPDPDAPPVLARIGMPELPEILTFSEASVAEHLAEYDIPSVPEKSSLPAEKSQAARAADDEPLPEVAHSPQTYGSMHIPHIEDVERPVRPGQGDAAPSPFAPEPPPDL
jgi:hypothetical protein